MEEGDRHQRQGALQVEGDWRHAQQGGWQEESRRHQGSARLLQHHSSPMRPQTRGTGDWSKERQHHPFLIHQAGGHLREAGEVSASVP